MFVLNLALGYKCVLLKLDKIIKQFNTFFLLVLFCSSFIGTEENPGTAEGIVEQVIFLEIKVHPYYIIKIAFFIFIMMKFYPTSGNQHPQRIKNTPI